MVQRKRSNPAICAPPGSLLTDQNFLIHSSYGYQDSSKQRTRSAAVSRVVRPYSALHHQAAAPERALRVRSHRGARLCPVALVIPFKGSERRGAGDRPARGTLDVLHPEHRPARGDGAAARGAGISALAVGTEEWLLLNFFAQHINFS